MTARPLALGLIFLGLCSTLRAQNAPEIQDNDHSPYHVALLDYKAGQFQEALDALKGTDPAKQDDNFVILEARILTELKRYDEGEKLLRTREANGELSPEFNAALGDLLLRKHSFDRAAKYYSLALQAKPNDPDLTLKLIYAEIGAGDLVDAGKIASQLTPLDPKNPYDDHASYYFAKAALAQATGKSQEAEDEIQSARTNYGITVTNRYLKTYLEVFAPLEKPPSSSATAPTGAKP